MKIRGPDFKGAQRSSSDGASGFSIEAGLRRATLRPFGAWVGFELIAAIVVLCAGCDEKPAAALRAAPGTAKHEHIPPHRGTPVVLGNEDCHLEFVRQPASGKLQAYVLDGEMENFVRVKQQFFAATATIGEGTNLLRFEAVPNNATGETIGDTSLFEASAPWLRTESNFDLIISEVTVRGKSYQQIKFNFPKGNDSDEK
jgi:hypothetical protein